MKTGNKTYYPDIYIYKDKIVEEIYEVETEETVDESSVDQWKLYSSGRAKFYLVVPKKSLEKAEEIVKKYKISVEGYWTFE